MDITQILTLADHLVYTNTGQHLDTLQEAILRGTIEGHTYKTIADDNYISESHIKDVGSELWKSLSQSLGKEVNKKNFRAIFKEIKNNSFSSTSIGQGNLTINNINLCQKPESLPYSRSPSSSQTKLHLNNAPKFPYFYGRNNELSNLKDWLINQEIRLISIFGMSGIGKTSIAVHVINELPQHFDYIIYRALYFSPSLTTTLTNLLQIFSPPEIPKDLESQINLFIDYLTQYQCLIILDDIQNLFTPQKLAGTWQTEQTSYHLFFHAIALSCHHSNIILLSQEKWVEIQQLEKANYPVKSLILSGLDSEATEILHHQNLGNQELWPQLITLYQSHPLWLELTAELIGELYAGNVSEFLEYQGLIVPEGVRSRLDQQWQKLSPNEQTIMLQLAPKNTPISISKIIPKIDLVGTEIVNSILSLKMRFLLETETTENGNCLSLSPVLKEYIKTRYSLT
jgi:DNA-binding CsgD family transcriptional regulator